MEEVDEWLLALAAKDSERPVLVPTNDVFIEYISERYQTLTPNFRLPSAYSRLAEELLDKKEFHTLCTRWGIPTPGVWGADNSRLLMALAEEVPYPCLLKPTLIHRARAFLNGRKVLVAR